MKIISMCNDRLQMFADNLQESLRRVGCEAIIHKLDEPPGEFDTPEFHAICYKKLEIVTAELAEGEPLLYVDADVVFRRNPLEDLEQRLAECDAVFQQEEPSRDNHERKGPHLWGAGFFAVKPTLAGKALVAPRGEGEKNWWEWHSDAGLLGTRLLAAQAVAVVDFLPTELYPSGWFQKNETIGPERYACHYNWTITDASKIKRMKKEGDWMI